MKIELAILVVAATSARAAADTETSVPVVVKHERSQELIVDAWVSGGYRHLDGGAFSNQSTSGLELGAAIGMRLAPKLGVVGVFNVEGMDAGTGYIKYIVNTIGVGVHWDGPIKLTVGGGVALESDTILVVQDVMVIDNSTTGAAAFAHATVPVLAIGSGHLGIHFDASAIALSNGPTILAGSAGVGVSW
jgi:hypothetical protein